MSWSPPGDTGQTLIPGLQGYTDLQLIAHGSTAMVFRATQNRLNRTVAIKVLLVDDVMTTAANVARELETTVALSSQPHIVSIIDTGNTADGSPYIIMEYCEGGSYAQILKRRGPLPVGEVLEVGVKIGEALHAAHDVGIIHRDVKPPNILRSRFGPALTDFGIARAADDGGVATSTLDKLTPQHASPEALLRGHQSGRSDLYSLASTMWNLLVGRAPFADPEQPRMDPLAFRQRVLDAPVPRVPRDDVPEWLQQELFRAMAKDPAERHRSAGEFANMLRLLGSRTEAPEAAPGGEEPLIWPSAQPVRTSPRPSPAADPDAPDTEMLGSQTAGPVAPGTDQAGGGSGAGGSPGVGHVGGGSAGGGLAGAGWPAESAVPPFSATPAGTADWPAPYTVPEHEPRYTPQPATDATAPPTVFPATDPPAVDPTSAPPSTDPTSAPPSYPTSGPPSTGFPTSSPPTYPTSSPPSTGFPTSAPPSYPISSPPSTGFPTSGPPSAYPASGPPATFPPHAAYPASGPPGPPPPMFSPVSAPPSDAYPVPYPSTPTSPPPRPRSLVKPLLVAGAIGVTLGLAATIGIIASRDDKQVPAATDPTPSPTGLTPGGIDLTKDGAPRDLRIEDAGTSVTLHWVDTTNGRAPFIVFGARDGQQTRVLKKEERGQNSTVVDGLTPRADYCFVVAAAVSAEKLANSDSACTRRLGGGPPSTPS